MRGMLLLKALPMPKRIDERHRVDLYVAYAMKDNDLSKTQLANIHALCAQEHNVVWEKRLTILHYAHAHAQEDNTIRKIENDICKAHLCPLGLQVLFHTTWGAWILIASIVDIFLA